MLNEGYGGKERPSEYFRRGQGFVSCEAGEEALPAIQRSLGDSVTMWASDYPHPDSTWPNSVAILDKEMATIDAAMRQKITHDNAKEFYKL